MTTSREADTAYALLEAVNERPEPFSEYSAIELWADEHTSSRMLAYHLDGSVDLSSRTTAFIDRSAAWIRARFQLDGGSRVADFGCGPGLYSTRLAASGASVTGFDVSERSIRFARQLAERLGLTIDHVQADYLRLELGRDRRFHLIVLIMCDYCVLSPSQRQSLLRTFLDHLEPGGAVLFDVYSLVALEAFEERTVYAPQLLDGFWSADPYHGFLTTFRYEAEKVTLDKYTIVEPSRTRVVYNWLQYYDAEALRRELEAAGFEVEEMLGDVAGAPFDATATEMALIARRPRRP